MLRLPVSYYFLLLVSPVYGALARFTVARYHDGIGLSDDTRGDEEDIFIGPTLEALQLIAEHDPRRYERIRRNIRWVWNGGLRSGGAYLPPSRICMVDISRFHFGVNRGWYMMHYAALLVHEATHGHLHSRYIPYNRGSKARIEAVCRREENRFLIRVQRSLARNGQWQGIGE